MSEEVLPMIAAFVLMVPINKCPHSSHPNPIKIHEQMPFFSARPPFLSLSVCLAVRSSV